jgi:hypothetical protein
MNAFERLDRAIADLWDAIWEAIQVPFEWIRARPWLILAYMVFCATLIVFELLAR